MAVLNTWSYIEIPQFHSRVRALLENLSEASLPDNYIDMPEKAPSAELYAKSRVANWENLNEVDFAMFESAIVYKTASMFENLVYSNRVKREKLQTMELEYFSNTSSAAELSLSDLADEMLNKLVGTVSAKTFFVVT